MNYLENDLNICRFTNCQTKYAKKSVKILHKQISIIICNNRIGSGTENKRLVSQNRGVFFSNRRKLAVLKYAVSQSPCFAQKTQGMFDPYTITPVQQRIVYMPFVCYALLYGDFPDRPFLQSYIIQEYSYIGILCFRHVAFVSQFFYNAP